MSDEFSLVSGSQPVGAGVNALNRVESGRPDPKVGLKQI
jgi:hypothetical protein